MSVEASGELRDGRLYGRGSSDIKGAAAAIVVAAERSPRSVLARVLNRSRGAHAGLRLAATVIWGPGEAAQAHQTDEWASAEMIEAAAEGFSEVARRWCGV